MLENIVARKHSKKNHKRLSKSQDLSAQNCSSYCARIIINVEYSIILSLLRDYHIKKHDSLYIVLNKINDATS